MTQWEIIAQHIAQASNKPFNPLEPRHVGGGCINQGVRLTDGERTYFVKLNSAALLDMFEAEADGLRAMAQTHTIRVPEPLCSGLSERQSYLAMEYIEMGHGGRGGSELAGRQLAAMHRDSQPDFGWFRDNTIGSTPQENQAADNWIDFWRDHRLGFQLRLAARNGYGGTLQHKGERLLQHFHVLIDHQPQPSLLHGDLWGGNLAYTKDGDPVIFDPAVYYGDREADLAMTELFGGFGNRFYDAYREAWPLAPGYSTRKILYNLYHILNHLNLFGSGYLGQASSMIDRLLAEV
ncbi:fructosamine kinase family protein [Candidatus Thiodiazotropha sp. CDECU1]|uniref:fructosamine kinase family protein n=1 Tax=Candidatus Thiodiazotropha sp. CDECU1 TaxID=3065865 RepID=UPI00292F494C|nr:fructosamine kinase family protein [Candidatus Thiodiazotropha sp. CDECU1]